MDQQSTEFSDLLFEVKNGTWKIVEVVDKEKTMFPPACKFESS